MGCVIMEPMSTTTRRKATKEQGTEWCTEAKDIGFVPVFSDRGGHAGSGVIALETVFTPGDLDAYIAAESNAFALISKVPRVSGGSTWGSTSDGVGGHAALTSGRFHLCVSGVSKRFGAGIR